LPLLGQAVKQAASAGLIGRRSFYVARQGEGYLLAGRLDEAIQLARQALDSSCDHRERGHEAWALRLLGEIAAHGDSPDVGTAETHYHEPFALATELGMRPLVAHCHLGLGRLYRRTGDQAKAEEHLATATAMYREMGMNFWLEKTEAAMGPPHRNSP
jgi:tetratricopeptide (TPR) repeat protein